MAPLWVKREVFDFQEFRKYNKKNYLRFPIAILGFLWPYFSTESAVFLHIGIFGFLGRYNHSNSVIHIYYLI